MIVENSLLNTQETSHPLSLEEMNPLSILSSFLEPHLPLQKPLLLGFSGGVDSLSLADALHSMGIPFHLAHFDHRWRKESQEEAQLLAQWAKERNLVFHVAVSEAPQKDELWAREERYAFFTQLFDPSRYQALVLAHQLDDQTETLLKRLFEGAHLSSLKGMEPISYRGEMPLWRPFLSLSKRELQAYAAQRGLKPLEDRTNSDEKYLRARMRQTIIPLLSAHFGKQIAQPLYRLGQEAAELHDYLQRQGKKFFSSQVRGPFGILWDFSPFFPLETVEIRFLLHTFFKQEGTPIGRVLLDTLIEDLTMKRAHLRSQLGDQEVIVDRGVLFLPQRPLPRFQSQVPLRSQTLEFEGWEWSIQVEEGMRPHQKVDWKDWWKGHISFVLPLGDYTLAPPSTIASKKWNRSHMPAFLRDTLPLLLEKEERQPDLWNRKGAMQSEARCLFVHLSVNLRA